MPDHANHIDAPGAQQASHYFTAPPDTLHKFRQLTVRDGEDMLTFETDAGVFSGDGLDDGTSLLLVSMKTYEPLTGRLLDLGCGWGALGVILARRNHELDVTLCDINPRAVELTRRNIHRNDLPAYRVRAMVSDGLSALTGANDIATSFNFNWIVMNPPIRAGKSIVHRLIDEASRGLTKGGRLMLVWRKQQGAPSAIDYLSSRFATVERVDRNKGYWIISCKNPFIK